MVKNIKVYFVVAISLIFLISCSFFTKKTNLIPRMILFGNPSKTLPKISPGGVKLAYLAPFNNVLNIWLKTVGKDDDKPITKDVGKGIHDFYWAKNNQHLIFIQDKNGDENWHVYKVDIETLETKDMTPFKDVRAYIHTLDKSLPNEVLILMNKENSKLFDVYNLNLISGQLTLVAKNPGNVDIWLADSNLNVKAAVTAKEDGSSELLLRENKDSKWITKLKWDFEDSLVGSFPPEGSRPIGFSIDNKSLYLIDSSSANTKRLVKMNLMKGKKEILSADDEYDIDSVVLNSDSCEPELVSFQKERIEWKALNTDSAQDLKIILSVNKGDLFYIDKSDVQKWIVGFLNDDGPSAYYFYDRKMKKIEFLFYDRPEILDYKLASMKPISFKSRDGLTIHGYLTCSPDKDPKNLPMVLDVHGGPWWRHVWGYDNTPHNITAQLLANRGYACLQVNFRGSSGYGKKFLNAGDREFGGKMQNDLVDATRWAVKEGIADPKKIAISGMSFGGYAALVGATFTPDVFCCAIDFWGPSNLVTMLKSIVAFRPMGKAKWYRRVGNPETEEEFLKSCSPLFKVNQIKIPILIAQGGNDPRVKKEESQQIVDAMKKRGLDYEYLFFPDEGHGIMGLKNRFKLSIAYEKFLAKHLGGRAEGINILFLLKMGMKFLIQKISSYFWFW
ncbi:S9 family peptidase [Candidatus Babeliales bacterium]|nr:S9 family peptidase [Candidatus Babeliales bacterium]